MFRIFFFILIIGVLSFGLSLVADMDGKLIIQWPGGEIQPTLMQAVIVFAALVLLVMLGWSLFRMILTSPGALSRYFSRKKQEKGLAALSSGLIAIGAGDKSKAHRLADQARKALPNDPMTQMLRAQAAQLKGDTGQATRIYESMLAASDTEIMGLRGLYLLALEQKEFVAAEQYVARAVKRRGDLQWAVMGLFDLQCKRSAWAQALETLKIAQVQGHLEAKKAKRQRAVLLTALAQELEDSRIDEALGYAMEAVRLAPGLIPAAVIAGRINASKSHMTNALKIVRKCWKLAPHPDLAMVSAFARPGDSVRDRLTRIQSLASLTPGHKEAAMAVAQAAVEAQDWTLARESLGPLVRGRPSQKVCTLMARIETQETGNKGVIREWLARAVSAPPDLQWVADGTVFDDWAPVSPISGRLDAFEWKVPDQDEMARDDSVTLKHMIAGLLTAEALDEAKEPQEPFEDAYDEQLPVVVETAEEPEEESKAEAEPVEVVEPEIIEPEKDEPQSKEAAREKNEKEENIPKKKRRRKRAKIYVAPPAPDDPGIDTDGDDTGTIKGMRPVRY